MSRNQFINIGNPRKVKVDDHVESLATSEGIVQEVERVCVQVAGALTSMMVSSNDRKPSRKAKPSTIAKQ